MTVAARMQRIDLERLRELVSVRDVLCAAGIEVDREGGRIACPLHGGSNPSAFSYTRDLYCCHAGCGGGDVFALVQALEHCAFGAAVAHVALLAGLPVDGLPRLNAAEVERQRMLARRRAALRRWRDARLGEWLGLIGHLVHDEQRLLARYMDSARDQDDPDADGWRLLASLYADLEAAMRLVAELSVDNERAWASLWLLEQRGRIATPDELRGGPAPMPKELRQ
jgi:hypothetical protein